MKDIPLYDGPEYYEIKPALPKCATKTERRKLSKDTPAHRIHFKSRKEAKEWAQKNSNAKASIKFLSCTGLTRM